MLVTLDGRDKVQIAIDRLKSFEPEDGYFVAFSGGKDSQAIYHLCVMAGVKFDAHYSITGVDPPELVNFIRDQYTDVKREIPHGDDGNTVTMWKLIPQKLMPPTRIARYCCEKLKECSGLGRITVTGVRWEESTRRKGNQGLVTIAATKKIREAALQTGAKLTKSGGIVMNTDNSESRRLVENCYRTRKTMVNPIIDWTEEDVWEFLNDVVKAPHCTLYDRGYKRIGCIGCPMSSRMEEDLAQYPKIRAAYMRAFDRMIVERKKRGLPTSWETSDEVMRWWIGAEDVPEQIEGQISMEEIMKGETDEQSGNLGTEDQEK